jgi:hypothetical protein
LETFKQESLNAAMKDLAVDKTKPWSGPGRDPRGNQFMDEVEEENIDDDDGDETYLDPGTYIDGLQSNLVTRH